MKRTTTVLKYIIEYRLNSSNIFQVKLSTQQQKGAQSGSASCIKCLFNCSRAFLARAPLFLLARVARTQRVQKKRQPKGAQCESSVEIHSNLNLQAGVKTCYWLSFYCVINRFLSLSQHFYT